MARKLRIQHAGAMCHVMNRGGRRVAIFRDHRDRCCFQETLGEACAKTGWQVHAYRQDNDDGVDRAPVADGERAYAQKHAPANQESEPMSIAGGERLIGLATQKLTKRSMVLPARLRCGQRQ